MLVHYPAGAETPIAWLADFGLSVDGPEATTNVTYTSYRAPELPYHQEDRRPLSTIPEEELGLYRQTRREVEQLMEKAEVNHSR